MQNYRQLYEEERHVDQLRKRTANFRVLKRFLLVLLVIVVTVGTATLLARWEALR